MIKCVVFACYTQGSMKSIVLRLVYALIAICIGVGLSLIAGEYIRDNFIALQLNPEESVTWYRTIVDAFQWCLFALSALLGGFIYIGLAFKEETQVSGKEQLRDVIVSQGQFRTLYELGPVPYFLVTPDGAVGDPNKAMLRMCKGTEKDIEGKALVSFIAQEDAEIWGDLWNKFKRGVAIADVELRVIPLSGKERFVLLSLFHIESGTKKGWGLGTFVDITERKEIDRAKTEFVSLAAHQLRTPISTIKWYAEMLAEGAKDLPEAQKKHLARIEEGTRNMNELVHTLLNVSRLEMGTLPIALEMTDVAKLATNILEELAPETSAKNLSIKTEFNVHPFSTDPKLLRIVMQNLISNAVKYTPEKGEVLVRIEQSGQGAAIEVIDTGFGIPKEEQDKIFTKLYRASNAREKVTGGNGLGLYMSKAITGILGGTLSFVSEKDKGTTFTLMVPSRTA